ncbi:hypothetical protein N9261_00165 [bacterium]|jgi:homoserine dehydrogenase|nr:hypothetical protein [bacterium]
MSATQSRPRPLVLKFGGAVLGEVRGVERAAECVERERARHPGAGVVVVVSALGATTDRLFEEAATAICGEDAGVAQHVRSGEEDAARRMMAALVRLGAPAQLCSPECLGLVTSGSLLDGDPEALNAQSLLEELYPEGGAPAVVVTMGYVAHDRSGQPSLLGRGGSDLTALFIAHHLGASDCVLLKNVDGIHEADPNAAGMSPPARLDEVPFSELESFGGRVLQAKAARFAVRHRLSFSLGSPDRPQLRTRVR